MAQYDGSIRIGTGIDTSGIKKDSKELEKELKNLADAQKSFLEAGGSKTSPVYQEYEKEVKALQSALESLKQTQGEQTEPQKDEHWNQLKIDVEEYAKSLKELQDQGKFFGDEDYDKVYLAWKNATDAVKAYQAELNKQTESGQAKIAEQEAKAAERKEAAQRKAEEQAEKALQRENERIQRQAEAEAKLQAKEAERQVKIEAEAAEEERLNQIRLNAVATNDEIIGKVERIKQLEKEITDLKAAGVTEGYTDYDNRIQELSELKDGVKEYRDSLTMIPKKFESMRKSAKKAFDAISEGTKKSNASLNGGLKAILKYGFGIRSLYTLFNKIRAGIQAGFTNLMGYSDSFANSIQSVKNSMKTLGNQIAGAFRPIVETVIPWLNALINALSTAMAYLAQFIAALSGKSTFTRAKQIQDKYNQSLNGTAKAADKARGALAKFDDLDVLQKQDTSSNGVGTGEILPKDMFEEATVVNEISEFAKKIKQELSDMFAPLKEAWNEYGDSISATLSRILEKIKEFGTELIKRVTGWFKELDWEPLLSSVDNLLIKIEPLVSLISEGLLWAWDNVLEPLGSWTIEEALPSLLDAIGGALELISAVAEKAAPALQAIWDNFLAPAADFVGDTITGFFEAVGKFLSDVANNETAVAFLTDLAIAIGVVSAAMAALKVVIWAVNAALYANPITWIIALIGLLVAAIVVLIVYWDEIVAGIKIGWNMLVETLQLGWEAAKSVLEKMKEGISNVLNSIKKTWDKIWTGAKDTVTNIFGGIWDAIKNVINKILGGIEGMVNGVINGINYIIRALNNLSFDVPDWVPGFGGKNFGFNITEMKEVSIPKLATGAVIRGGNPFMAILGDQPAGKTNIEAPAGLIKDMVAQGIAEAGIGSRENIPVNINIIYDGETTARVMIPDILSELSRQGYNVDLLGYT